MAMTGVKREGVGRVAGTRAEENTRTSTRWKPRRPGLEPAASFHARLSQSCGTDIDLVEVLQEQRQPHDGVEL